MTTANWEEVLGGDAVVYPRVSL